MHVYRWAAYSQQRSPSGAGRRLRELLKEWSTLQPNRAPHPTGEKRFRTSVNKSARAARGRTLEGSK